MADISTEIAAIQAASRGEEVRDSIVSALGKVNSNPTITIDSAPTSGSGNAVSSGGVYDALQNVGASIPLEEGSGGSSLQQYCDDVPNDASGDYSLAQGYGTTASGFGAVSMGYSTNASGDYTLAAGGETAASGANSAAFGDNTVAQRRNQLVFGAWNVADTGGSEYMEGDYIEIVGNGNDQARANARTLDWDGNEVLAGKLTLGAQAVNANDVPTLAQVQALIAAALNS